MKTTKRQREMLKLGPMTTLMRGCDYSRMVSMR